MTIPLEGIYAVKPLYPLGVFTELRRHTPGGILSEYLIAEVRDRIG